MFFDDILRPAGLRDKLQIPHTVPDWDMKLASEDYTVKILSRLLPSRSLGEKIIVISEQHAPEFRCAI